MYSSEKLQSFRERFSLLLFLLIALPVTSNSEELAPIRQNPNLTIVVPHSVDIQTFFSVDGRINRCCGIRICVPCDFIDFPKGDDFRLPTLKNGQVLRILHKSGDDKKALNLCPDDRDDTIHQCREIQIMPNQR